MSKHDEPPDYMALHKKYNSVSAALTMQPDVRKDVADLLQANVDLLRDLAGARQTLLALCMMSPTGYIDVPYHVVRQIAPTDVLRASEEEMLNPEGGEPLKVKRFSLGLRSVVTAMPKVN